MNKRPSTSNPNTKPSPILPPRGLRIMDAANYAALSPFYVETLIRSGELPALKLCQHYTILKEDLDDFLDRKREALENERRVRYPETSR
jgi:excisionase family DNA binding protein